MTATTITTITTAGFSSFFISVQRPSRLRIRIADRTAGASRIDPLVLRNDVVPVSGKPVRGVGRSFRPASIALLDGILLLAGIAGVRVLGMAVEVHQVRASRMTIGPFVAAVTYRTPVPSSSDAVAVVALK